MDQIRSMLSHSIRIYRNIPFTTALAVLSIALGICGATTVFSIVDGVLLKPLPFASPERVSLVWRLAPSGMSMGYSEYPWGLREVALLKAQVKSFQALSAFKASTFVLTNVGEPATLEGIKATPEFFSVFGTRPILGRGFSAGPTAKDEVVLSYELWRNRFGKSPSVVGQAIQLNSRLCTIVGVMPAAFRVPEASTMPNGFEFPATPELWMSMPAQPTSATPGGIDELAIAARLYDANGLATAQQELNLFAARQDREFPKFSGWFRSRITPFHEQIAGPLSKPLLLLQLAVLLVVGVCCVNVANLLLVLSFARRTEFGIRSAMGATPYRIMRQLVLESSLLTAVAGLIGVLLSLGGIVAVRHMAPPEIPRLQDVSLSLPVLGFAIALTGFSGILNGLIPAFWAAKGDVFSALREGTRSFGNYAEKTRDALLGGEIGLALILVIASGLLGRTLLHMSNINPGFDANNRVAFQVFLPSVTYPTRDAEATALQELLRRIEDVPGVRSAALVSALPMGDVPPELTVVRLLDRPPVPEKERPFVDYSVISSQYFRTAGINLEQGRDFTAEDSSDHPRVTIINETMARQFWPNSSAIGKSLDFGFTRSPVLTVVGVAHDVKHKSMRETGGPEMYVPYTQRPWSSIQNVQFVVNTDPGRNPGQQSFSRAIQNFDKGLSVAKFGIWQQLVNASMADIRFAVVTVSTFGGLSLFLASIGIYAVMGFVVQRRTQEIGVRMALGSRRGDIFRLILRYGTTVAGAGVTFGAALSALTAFLMRHFLFGISIFDPLTFCAGPFVVMAVAALACYFPAQRAMNVEPMIALRER